MDKSLLLKKDIIKKESRRSIRRCEVVDGDPSRIQDFIIGEARKFAKKKAVTEKNAKLAWCYFDYLKQYDEKVTHSKRTLESMLENTDEGNKYTPAEFLNYVAFCIAQEVSKKWSTLGGTPRLDNLDFDVHKELAELRAESELRRKQSRLKAQETRKRNKLKKLNSNNVQTYNTFNQGRRRPSRKEHLRQCGYTFIATLDPQLGKPKVLAMERLNAKSEATAKCFHGVYIPDVRSLDGNIGYSLYAKEIA